MTSVAACSCGQLTAHVGGEALRVAICHCLAGTATAFTPTGGEGARATFYFGAVPVND